MQGSLHALNAFLKQAKGRDVIVVSRGINRQLHQDLSRKLRSEQKNKKCTLILTTYGGNPDAAYRIARCLRHRYEHVRLIVPSYCRNAGTLLAIVADELVIGDLGELGPLAIQVTKNSELAERSSGFDIIQALQATLSRAQQAFRNTLTDILGVSRLSTKLARKFASRTAIGVTEPIHAQISPLRLGEMQRAIHIAHKYGQRLNKCTGALRPGSLEKLFAENPTHDFVMGRKEAATLFSNISLPTSEENEFCFSLWDLLENQRDCGPEFIVQPPADEHPEEEKEDVQAAAALSGEGEEGIDQAAEQLSAVPAEANE